MLAETLASLWSLWPDDNTEVVSMKGSIIDENEEERPFSRYSVEGRSSAIAVPVFPAAIDPRV